ncbi:MAG: hypothetical protein KY444_10980 [Gemmatimonadetes bacterium]|nr:hypothetical protein [Gemmatimonadota bacterium]
MKKLICSLAAAVALTVASAALTPGTAEAQCTYGCACEKGACGCNSNGNGDRCDAGGTGCVVSKCGTEEELAFAPDGSVIRLASAAVDEDPARQPAGNEPAPTGAMSGSTRWEYVSDGHSVARNCSGVVVARYYDARTAAAIRRKDSTLTL